MQVSKEQLEAAVVRKYSPEDRSAVRTICYDTGLIGDPIDPYFGCFDLFADIWTTYYTDYEPESCFTAELDGKVVGYLMGSKDTVLQEEIHRRKIMPQVRRKLFTFGYKVDRRFFSFMCRHLRTWWRGELSHNEDEIIREYPAHLHMNLAEGYRSGAIGSKLMSAYLDYLRENNVRGLHLGTTSHNRLALPFYEKWGFRIVSRRCFTLYEGIVPGKMELLFFARELA